MELFFFIGGWSTFQLYRSISLSFPLPLSHHLFTDPKLYSLQWEPPTLSFCQAWTVQASFPLKCGLRSFACDKSQCHHRLFIYFDIFISEWAHSLTWLCVHQLLDFSFGLWLHWNGRKWNKMHYVWVDWFWYGLVLTDQFCGCKMP